MIVELLRMNRDTLVAQNMIENGNNREVAGREVDHLLEDLELVSRVDIKIETESDQLRLIARLDLAQPATEPRP